MISSSPNKYKNEPVLHIPATNGGYRAREWCVWREENLDVSLLPLKNILGIFSFKVLNKALYMPHRECLGRVASVVYFSDIEAGTVSIERIQ